MNLVRNSAICVVCAMVLVLCGCTQERVSVVNTSSGIVIHAEDYANLNKPEVNKPNGNAQKEDENVIYLGRGYESIDLPSVSR